MSPPLCDDRTASLFHSKFSKITVFKKNSMTAIVPYFQQHKFYKSPFLGKTDFREWPFNVSTQYFLEDRHNTPFLKRNDVEDNQIVAFIQYIRKISLLKRTVLGRYQWELLLNTSKKTPFISSDFQEKVISESFQPAFVSSCSKTTNDGDT